MSLTAGESFLQQQHRALPGKCRVAACRALDLSDGLVQTLDRLARTFPTKGVASKA